MIKKILILMIIGLVLISCGASDTQIGLDRNDLTNLRIYRITPYTGESIIVEYYSCDMHHSVVTCTNNGTRTLFGISNVHILEDITE